jgi:5-methylcytosine-specific restriction enzyme A
MNSARLKQLEEVWRVALARLNGKEKTALHEIAGPLAIGSIGMVAQNLKEMFRGRRYTQTMTRDDTEYLLTRIEHELGAKGIDQALSSLDQHINYWNGLGKGKLKGLRALHDQWRAKPGYATSLASLDGEFAAAVADSLALDDASRAKKSATWPEKPTRRQTTITVCDRNPHVVAAALKRAKGKCEGCNSDAPFARRSDRTPYLEVHHRIPLAEDGLDTIDNAIALCPNCHREAHHGEDTVRFLKPEPDQT